ncbi:MAG: PepSY-like domain-containing protein, partial [Saprospiraceae bacterium]|nr:PepSY-like domain-containing protein [Saprospiraceae bacterium]
MKNLFFLSLLALLATTMSCELLENDDIFPNDDNSNDGSNVNNAIFSPCEEDDDIAFAQLPASIQQYLAENYPNATFNDIERINGAEVRFGIEIEQGATDYEILFSADGTILSEGDEVEDTIIDAITLPVSTLEYLDANFPGVNITSAESDGEYGVFYYEVYLANGVELYFAQDGSLLC